MTPGSHHPVTDAQVHVWAPPRADRPWAPGAERYANGVANLSSAERAPLSAEELLGQMGTAGVDRVVLVPPTFEGDRNDVALDAARRWPDRFRVMGRFPVTDTNVRGTLRSWQEQDGMIGIRLTFHWGEQQQWLHDGSVDWFWPEAERAGIPVAVYAPGGLGRVASVARRHPSLRLIVDHFALPLAARDADVPAVVDELVSLASLPNVAVKASALPSYTNAPYPFRPLHDPIRRVVDAFGVRRVFWGSEVSRLPCTYREAVTVFTEELDFLSDDDLAWVMGRGISEWLGWPEPADDTSIDSEQGAATP